MNIREIQHHADFDQHELVEFCDNGRLTAIIAVHNSNLGPAVGGCRMFPYSSQEDALTDVLRLSRGMTYKSALAGLPLGGGKAVIIGNPRTDKTRDLLLAMGEFVDSLNGRYITAEDSGTSVADMAVMAAFGHECAEGTFTRCLQRESAFEFQGAAHQYAGYQGFSQQLAD